MFREDECRLLHAPVLFIPERYDEHISEWNGMHTQITTRKFKTPVTPKVNITYSVYQHVPLKSNLAAYTCSYLMERRVLLLSLEAYTK